MKTEELTYVQHLIRSPNGAKPIDYKIVLRFPEALSYETIEREINELIKRLSDRRYKRSWREKHPTQEYAYTHCSLVEGASKTFNLHAHVLVWLPDAVSRGKSSAELEAIFEADTKALKEIWGTFKDRCILKLDTQFRYEDENGNPEDQEKLAHYLSKQGWSALKDGWDSSRDDRWIGGRYARGIDPNAPVGSPPQPKRYQYRKLVGHRWHVYWVDEALSDKEVRKQKLLRMQ